VNADTVRATSQAERGPAQPDALRPDASPGVLPPGVRPPDAARAVTDLFTAHHLELVRLALLMVGDLAVAEDVVQDVFERLHRRWPDLRDGASGLAYARASVLNGCRSVHRRNTVARKYTPQLAAAPGPCPDTAEASAERSSMLTALRGLPRRQREVLVLRYYADLDVCDISATLDITPSAVRSTMSRGLTALARALREN
jgi:RNA polymerase sigma-70 factor (sigma-E family)